MRISEKVVIGKHAFYISDGPVPENVPQYLERYQALGVTHIVRACDPMYDGENLPFNVVDFNFADGKSPSPTLVSEYREFLDNNPNAVIAIHCVAGLGRAPVLVAIAAIDTGMKPLDAIEFIRKYRRGAFNSNQIRYLDSELVKKKRKRFNSPTGQKNLLKFAGTSSTLAVNNNELEKSAHADASKSSEKSWLVKLIKKSISSIKRGSASTNNATNNGSSISAPA